MVSLFLSIRFPLSISLNALYGSLGWITDPRDHIVAVLLSVHDFRFLALKMPFFPRYFSSFLFPHFWPSAFSL